MSEILTRESAAQHIEWLTREASNQEWADLPLTIASFKEDVDALLDAHDAALEQVRSLGAALDVVTRHWIGRTDAHGIGFDEDVFEQQLMALDRAFAALAAVATPQGQEVNDANG